MIQPTLHLSLVTLGVRDLDRATAFYAALGAVRSAAGTPELSVFTIGTVAIALFDRARLAEDAQVPDVPCGFSGITLAWNQPSEQDVDAALARAGAAGATILKAPLKVFWGGYSGYFADLDGHLWEVAHNPFWPLGADGRLAI